MNNNTGLLSLDIYNPAGKNQFFVGSGADYTQNLRIRIANNRPGHTINLTKTGGYHFSLILKKGLLPESFGKKDIEVTQWRQVKGEDILDRSKLDSPAFNVEDIKNNNQLDIKIEEVAKELKKLISEQKKDAAKNTSKIDAGEKTLNDSKKKTTDSTTTESEQTYTLEQVKTYLQNAGEDVNTIFETLLELLKVVEDDKFQKEHEWVKELGAIRDLYKKSLNDLRELSQAEGVLSQNAFLTGFTNMAAVFKDFSDLHERTIRIISELEMLDLKLQKKKATITEDAYSLVKQQLVTDLKPFLENLFRVESILEPLKNIKLSEFFKLDDVSLNENIMRQLEQKLVVEEEAMKGAEWEVKRKAIKDSTEEEEIQFICKAAGKDKISINTYGYLLIDITLTGTLEGKAGSANVQLSYPNAELLDKENKPAALPKDIKEKYASQSIINLLNYGDTGLPVPIRLDVIKGRQILNNGEYSNEATIQLTNTGKEPIFLDKKSCIEVSFDVQNENEVRHAALMEKDNTKDLQVGLITLEATLSGKDRKTYTMDKDATYNQVLKEYYDLKAEKTTEAVIDEFAFSLLKNKNKTINHYRKTYIFRETPDRSERYDIYVVNDLVTDSQKNVITPEISRYRGATEHTHKPELDWYEAYQDYYSDKDNKSYQKITVKGIELPNAKSDEQLYIYAEKKDPDKETINFSETGLLFKEVKGLEGVYKVFDAKVRKVADKYEVADNPEFKELIRIKKAVKADGKSIDVSVENLGNDPRITMPIEPKANTINASFSKKLSKQMELPPNKSLVVKLRGLKTKLLPGDARVEIALLNVPKFKDTIWGAIFERVAFFSTQNAGVFNTGTENEKLLMTGKKTVQLNAGEYHLDVNKEEGLIFKQGERTIFNLKDISSLHRQLLPYGCIMLWYGDKNKVPAGWKICDGDNTPNLTDRFVLGAGNRNKGTTGGSDKIELKVEHLPAHTHKATGDIDNADRGYFYDFWNLTRNSGTDRKAPSWSHQNTLSHNHNINIAVDSTGGNKAYDYMPPYYALYYIMKIEEDWKTDKIDNVPH